MIPEPGPLSSDPFDALADLFLGELGRVAAHDVAVGLVPGPVVPAAAHPASHPAELGAELAGAGPSRPRLTLVKPAAEPSAGDDAEPVAGVDRAGGLRVIPEAAGMPAEPPVTAEPAALPGPMIEALVLGHLPVLASAWAARYVRHAAEQEGRPVGLIRLAGGQVRVELVAPPGSAAPEVERAGSLHEAWLRLLHACQRIVVHADAEHEPALIDSAMVDEVTLLSAADEAAVVNAYRTLRTIAGRTAGTPSGQASLRVAVMGAPEPRARYVWSRLEEAAESFLGRPLRCAGLIGQIGAGVPGRVLFVGPCRESAAEVVTHLTSAASAGRIAPKAPAPVLHAEAEEDDLALELGVDRAMEPAGTDGVVHAEHRLAETRVPEPKPLESPTAAASPESLAELVAGLTPIAARCPNAEDIELAIDAGGGLHALATAGTGPEVAVLSRLTVAASWAAQHRNVLQLTLDRSAPALRAEAAAMHLFTPAPAAHRPLLDTPVRVHLLAAVPPRQTAGWMAAALN